MYPKFHTGDRVLVNGEALYAELIRPPKYSCGDYLVKLVYPLAEIRTRVYRTYAEKYWRLKVK